VGDKEEEDESLLSPSLPSLLLSEEKSNPELRLKAS
jgi:hypothetical protein